MGRLAQPVLVIDGDEDVREGLRAILETEGWLVETAEDGRQALNKIAGGLKPCIILLDLLSPVMNAIEFRRELQNHRDLLPISLVAYSGLVDVRKKAQALAAREGRVPAEIDRLIAAVRQSC